ncbi:MarR family transcriptional regulator [Corynebacterium auris]|uniref:MarR family transcriptional regulator n=1 Tax=Corynebacterium auris TaxID=44750 RepID=UPI0025B2E58E|nr:MarR family transcriptional regulator [Corynebacterium auris]WJY66957.1 MarR family protein [Corynebacterium auris]
MAVPPITQATPRPVHFHLPSDTAGRCLQQVRVHPGITRRELQEDLGLTQATTSRLITRLEKAGLVRLGEPQDIGPGRPSAGLYVDGADLIAVGAHVGKRETHLALTDLQGQVLAQDRIALDVSSARPADALETLAWRMAHLAERSAHPVRHAGVAFSADISDDGTITSPTYGWDRVPALALTHEALGRVAANSNFAPDVEVEVCTGVSAMAAAELAYMDLRTHDGGAHTRSALYVYAREVVSYAWIVHGGIHRPRLRHKNPLLSRFLHDSPLAGASTPHGTDPLSVSALLACAADRGFQARTLPELVQAARFDAQLASLLDHRANILGGVVDVAVQVVDPAAVVLAGETFSADPLRTRRIAGHVMSALGNDYALKAYPAGTDVILEAAKMIALNAPWQRPLTGQDN